MSKKKSKILTPNNALVINDMILKNTGRKREILIELKKLNADANKFMVMPGLCYGKKYNLLQQTSIWIKAKKLIIEFNDSMVKCAVCKKQLDNHDRVMHHLEYHLLELFNPIYIGFVHDKCHESIFVKKEGK